MGDAAELSIMIGCEVTNYKKIQGNFRRSSAWRSYEIQRQRW